MPTRPAPSRRRHSPRRAPPSRPSIRRGGRGTGWPVAGPGKPCARPSGRALEPGGRGVYLAPPAAVSAGTVVIALGGNALAPAGERPSIANQFRHTRESLAPVVELAGLGW